MIDRPSPPITTVSPASAAPQDPTRREWCLTAAGGLVLAGLPVTADSLFELREGWMLLKTDR